MSDLAPAEYDEEEDQEVLGDFTEDDTPSVEDRARAMGWHPLPKDPNNPQPGDYRGDPRRHTDAAAFIAHGEEQLPILRDQTRRLSDKLARATTQIEGLSNTVAEQARAVKDAMDLARRSDERGYNRAVAEMRAEQRDAVAAGDTVAYDQVQERLDAAAREREVANTPASREPAPASEGIWPETTAFINDNPWFNSDPVLKRAMIAEHEAVLKGQPSLSRAQQYARAKARVVADFPDSFPESQMSRAPAAETEQQRPRRAAVLAPSAPAQPRRQGSPFDRIEDVGERDQAKAAFVRLQNNDPGMTPDEYMTLYDNPKADPLALRSARKK